MRAIRLAPLALLFLLAFGATLLVERKRQTQATTPLPVAQAPVADVLAVPQPGMIRYSATLPEVTPAVMVSSTTVPGPVDSAADNGYAVLPQTGIDDDPEDRARAVQDLRQIPAGSSVPALLQVLATDRDRRNRITAIQRLAQLGASQAPGISQLLRGYSVDADPVIAAQAREASESLAN